MRIKERKLILSHKIPDPAPIKILLGMNFLEKIKLIINGKGEEFFLEDPA